MNSIVVFSLAVFAVLTFTQGSPLNRADDLQPVERQMIAEMATNILKIVENGFASPKRNAELINSLLGLPKMMNDAGK
uniref:Pigment-dispersing factor I n=1 Tax=Ooperipatus hispidus TaxID=1198994 RepID=A0A0D3QSX7_9BILA|nr:pigment-dispersing factor I precursor [Ooperipatus hispidus]